MDVGHLRLEGKRCVMFETLLRDHTMLAEHADINDEHQEVQIASIGTQLTTEGGAHELQVTSAVSQAQLDAQLGIQVRESDDDVSQVEVVLTDTVAYANLLADMPYRMDGELHLRGFDNAGHARDAGVLKDHAGNTVVASVEFTPKFIQRHGEARIQIHRAETGSAQCCVGRLRATVLQSDAGRATADGRACRHSR